MDDYGVKVADKAIDKATRRVRRIYQQAAKELEEKLKEFKAKHAEADKKKRAELEAGKITEEEYQDWLMGQVFTGKRWQEKIDQAARIMNTANEQAAEIVNNGRLNVFAENYNYSAYETEKIFGRSVNPVVFNIYNTQAVARLIQEKPKMLPEWNIDKKKDYIWNREKIENAITQAIIQGESLDRITDRLVDKLCTQNENKMRMFARTAMNGAQNAGVQKQIEDSAAKGIEMVRIWRATLDERTRPAHAALDGKEVGINEPFRYGDDTINYPGDPSCSNPAMIYNCRCKLERRIKGVKRKVIRRAYDEPDEKGYRRSYLVEDMTYEQWKAWKERGMK